MPSAHKLVIHSTGLAFVLGALGCATSEGDVFATKPDTGAAKTDSGSSDTGAIGTDSGTVDSGTVDSGSIDSGTVDSGEDTSIVDSGEDTALVDSSVVDSSVVDSGDDTSVVDSGDDTSVVDTGVDPGTDTGTDAGTGGPLKLADGAVSLHGVTTDGFAIYTTGSTTYAIALAGGAPKIVGSSVEAILVSGKVVFTWTGISSTTGFGALSVWSDAWGSKSIAASALTPGDTGATYFVAGASADGQWIAYTDGAAWSGLDDVASIRTAKSDGTSVKTVFASTIVYDGSGSYGENCAPYMRFAGARLVTTHCAGTSGALSLNVSSFDPATSVTPTTLGSTLEYYPAIDPTGTKVSVVSGGALRVVPAAGGAGVTIDTGTKYASFSSDGATIVYLTTGNALKRSSTTTASPTTLVASGVADLLSPISPDDKWILVSSTSSSSGYDVRLASITTAGTPTVLLAATTGDVFGDAFTADSSRALWYASLDSLGAGTLSSQPVAGGATTTLGTGAWISYAISGSKVLWNDGHVGTSTSGTATIKVRDLASAAGDTVVATGADRGYALTTARDKVVYTYPSGGLWVASIP